MRNVGLKLRMILVGGILFAFYLAASTILAAMFGVNLLVILGAGLLILPPLQYKLGKWMALRGADDLPDTAQYSHIHQMVESIAADMDVEKPRLMIMEMGVPNAFAVGRKGAGVVCLSEELIRLLDNDELEGVVAHEIAHIRNRDVITMILGQSIAMMVGYVAYFAILMGGKRNIGTYFVAIMASSIANMLVMIFVMAISRYREYVADDDARATIGSGDPLARALEKIAQGSEGREPQIEDSVNALCIFNADTSLFQRIFSTHPPAEKRIARLRSAA